MLALYVSVLGFIGLWHDLLFKHNGSVEIVFSQVLLLFSFVVYVVLIIYVLYLAIHFRWYIRTYYCFYLFGCSEAGIDKAMKILIPLYVVADLLFFLFGAFVLRLIYKFLQTSEVYNKKHIDVRTALTPIVHLLGMRLPRWSNYFLCCRKARQRKYYKRSPLFKCDCACKAGLSRGIFALIALGIFFAWIVASIITCYTYSKAHPPCKCNTDGFIPTYCALFELTFQVFKSMGT